MGFPTFARAAGTLLLTTTLAIGATSLPAPAATAATAACTPEATWGARNGAFESRVVTLVNQHRQGLGLPTVTVASTLRDAAAWKSQHMANYGYMTHDDPAPPIARTTGQRIADCGYPTNRASWGENIAYGYSTPEAVMQAWLNSPGHRKNIENASFRAIGVGAAAKGSGPYYWAQEFGSLADTETATPSTSTPRTTPSATATRTPTATPIATVTPAPTAPSFQFTFPSRLWTWPWR